MAQRSKTTQKKSQPGRPANSWVLYRSDMLVQLPPARPARPQSEASSIISVMWKAEPMCVRDEYARRAEEAQRQHQIDYPNYQFTPIRRTTPSDEAVDPVGSSPSSSSGGPKRKPRAQRPSPYSHEHDATATLRQSPEAGPSRLSYDGASAASPALFLDPFMSGRACASNGQFYGSNHSHPTFPSRDIPWETFINSLQGDSTSSVSDYAGRSPQLSDPSDVLLTSDVSTPDDRAVWFTHHL